MPGPEIEPAARWRTSLAGAADVAIGWAVLAALRGRLDGPRARAVARVGAPAVELVREQLGSPGQRLFGVRTVDRRTGRRVALWRTAVVVAAGAAAQLVQRRVLSPTDAAADSHRRAFTEEARQISERHRDDPARRDAEFRRAALDHGPPPIWPGLARIAGTGVALSLLRRRLRRRLAPTAEVRV